MLAYIDGQFIPADRPALAVNDRSFLYGDGLFETIRITNGQPFLWREHLERLRRGAAFLRIQIPNDDAQIEAAARHLLSQNDVPEGMVRIHLSRGTSERGYSIQAATNPTLVITTHKRPHPGPRALRLITSTVRVLADDPLTQHKTANRLPNIRARMEADEAQADEAILLNHRDEIAEASAANVFIIRGRELVTPPLASGALAGTTRAHLLGIAAVENLDPREAPLKRDDLERADGVCLTSAHWLVESVASLDGKPVKIHPAVAALRRSMDQGVLANR